MAGAKDLAEQSARRALAQLDVAPVADPLTALSELAGQVVAWQRAMAGKVNDLTGGVRYEGAGGEQLRAEVALWERAMDRCNTVLATMAKLNIDERLARVNERQAELVAEALAAVLGEMGLSHEQQREARRGVARRLRIVPG